jgi:hypothetical protein
MRTNKKGRPTNETNICTCCQIDFKSSKRKCTHESNMRNRKVKTEITSSIGEKLNQRMEDFFETPLN